MKYLILSGYLLLVNIIAFAMMGIDKSRARNGGWRISERALFLSAILGGALGANLGMQLFRHKTKHWYFVIFMPVILVVWIVLTILLVKTLLH